MPLQQAILEMIHALPPDKQHEVSIALRVFEQRT